MNRKAKHFALIFTAAAVVFSFVMFFPYIKNSGEKDHTHFDEIYGLSEEMLCKKQFACPAECAVLMDEKSGKILFKKNEQRTRGMASTTKIMTALVAIETQSPEKMFAIPKSSCNIEGSSVYLKEGERLSVYELLCCLLLESGNDSASALSVCCGGTEENFVRMMNRRALEMGIHDTEFKNPHGLSSENHKTSAKSLALIAREALKYPLFEKIVSSKRIDIGNGYDSMKRTLINHNKMLWQYKGAAGIKTGYTRADGKCLVSSAKRNGLSLIAVTLNDPCPTKTHRELLDYGFENFESRLITGKKEIKTYVRIPNGKTTLMPASNPECVFICLPKGAQTEMRIIYPRFVKAPVKKHDIIAKAICIYNGKVVYIINLEAEESTDCGKISLFEKIFKK